MTSPLLLRNEAYLSYVVMTKDEAQRRRWIFYEVVILVFLENLRRVPDVFLLSEGKDKSPWRYRGTAMRKSREVTGYGRI